MSWLARCEESSREYDYELLGNKLKSLNHVLQYQKGHEKGSKKLRLTATKQLKRYQKLFKD
jgi:hypothetical protein